MVLDVLLLPLAQLPAQVGVQLAVLLLVPGLKHQLLHQHLAALQAFFERQLGELWNELLEVFGSQQVEVELGLPPELVDFGDSQFL